MKKIIILILIYSITIKYGKAMPSICMDWIQDDANNLIAMRAAKFAPIVKNQIQYTALDTEFTIYNKEYYFDEINNDTTLLNLGEPDDGDYITMYNQLKNANIGSFNEIRKKIDDEDYTNAKDKNDNINPHHLIEQNRKTAMQIYLQTFAKDTVPDSAQTVTLTDIALMTPYIGGDAVYSARVMLGIDPDEYGVSYRLIKPENQKPISEVKVFPNPAKDNITIAFPDNFNVQDAEINFYGILGNLIFSSKLVNAVTDISIENLNQGLYYYCIIVNKNTIAKDKLIIIK